MHERGPDLSAAPEPIRSRVERDGLTAEQRRRGGFYTQPERDPLTGTYTFKALAGHEVDGVFDSHAQAEHVVRSMFDGLPIIEIVVRTRDGAYEEVAYNEDEEGWVTR